MFSAGANLLLPGLEIDSQQLVAIDHLQTKHLTAPPNDCALQYLKILDMVDKNQKGGQQKGERGGTDRSALSSCFLCLLLSAFGLLFSGFSPGAPAVLACVRAPEGHLVGCSGIFSPLAVPCLPAPGPSCLVWQGCRRASGCWSRSPGLPRPSSAASRTRAPRSPPRRLRIGWDRADGIGKGGWGVGGGGWGGGVASGGGWRCRERGFCGGLLGLGRL